MKVYNKAKSWGMNLATALEVSTNVRLFCEVLRVNETTSISVNSRGGEAMCLYARNQNARHRSLMGVD